MCEICGRSSCTRSFHSLEEQEEFDTKTGRYSPTEDDEPETDRVAIEDAYAAGFAAGELAERNRCRYPECTENEDERCPRWLTGKCAGPSTEFMP